MTQNKNQLSFFCQDGHEFEMADNGYYKNLPDGEGKDSNIVYRMIYCVKCGLNLEIVVADRTPISEKEKRIRERAKNYDERKRRNS